MRRLVKTGRFFSIGATWVLLDDEVMGGIAGGLFAVFDFIGYVFFLILIGDKRASRRELRGGRVVGGGIFFCVLAGGLLGWKFIPPMGEDAPSPLVLGALIGVPAGFILAMTLLGYVSGVERAEREERREKRWREEQIAKGRDPDRSCFIATAVFGSADAPETVQLRAWRDKRLASSAIGRLVTGVYYAASPPIARVIERGDVLRAIARRLLRAFIGVLSTIREI